MQIITEQQPVQKNGNVAVNKPTDAALRVRDAEGEEYVLLQSGHPTEIFQAAGAAGTHTAETLDEDGNVLEAETFQVADD